MYPKKKFDLQFASRKIGDDEISNACRAQLKINLDNLKDELTKILESYTFTMQSYNDAMNKALNEIGYFSQGDLIKLHQNSKDAVIEQVWLFLKRNQN